MNGFNKSISPGFNNPVLTHLLLPACQKIWKWVVLSLLTFRHNGVTFKIRKFSFEILACSSSFLPSVPSYKEPAHPGDLQFNLSFNFILLQQHHVFRCHQSSPLVLESCLPLQRLEYIFLPCKWHAKSNFQRQKYKPDYHPDSKWILRLAYFRFYCLAIEIPHRSK